MIYLRKINIIHKTEKPFISFGNICTAMLPFQSFIKSVIQQSGIGEPGRHKKKL